MRATALGAYLVASIPLVPFLVLVMGAVPIAAVVHPERAGDPAYISTLRMVGGMGMAVCMVFVHFVTAALYNATRYRGGKWM